MKILLPSATSHTIPMKPRINVTDVLSVVIKNEAKGTVTTVVPTYTLSHGIMLLTFTLVGLEGETFTVKLLQATAIVYRCKLFFTAQPAQNYKITKNKYIYA